MNPKQVIEKLHMIGMGHLAASALVMRLAAHWHLKENPDGDEWSRLAAEYGTGQDTLLMLDALTRGGDA